MIKFNHYEVVSGTSITEIPGQFQIGYSLSDTIDFYDMAQCPEKEDYRGSVILFYDYNNGRIYTPFKQQKNVLYSKPVYLKDYFWFLQGDYNIGKISLFRYIPDGMPEMITQFDITEVNPYNLQIVGEDVHIISEDDHLECYYPEKFRFTMDSKENVIMIADGKVYLSAWVEEGWDHANDCASKTYKFYEKMIVRDFKGTILSEEIGSLSQHPDGTWWLS